MKSPGFKGEGQKSLRTCVLLQAQLSKEIKNYRDKLHIGVSIEILHLLSTCQQLIVRDTFVSPRWSDNNFNSTTGSGLNMELVSQEGPVGTAGPILLPSL